MKQYVEVPIVALIDPDERILLSKQPDDKPLGGYWMFPGGKREKGESVRGALARELKEELDIDICVECLTFIDYTVYEYPHITVKLYLFVGRRWDGIVKPNEYQTLKWTKKDGINNYKMPEPSVKLLNSLFEFI